MQSIGKVRRHLYSGGVGKRWVQVKIAGEAGKLRTGSELYKPLIDYTHHIPVLDCVIRGQQRLQHNVRLGFARMQRAERDTDPFKDAVSHRVLGSPTVINSEHYDHELRVKLGCIELPHTSRRPRQNSVQNVLDAVPRDADVESIVLATRFPKGLVPYRATILLPTDPRVVVEQPEVSDGVAHKKQLDSTQVFAVAQIGIDCCFSLLPMFDAWCRLGGGKRCGTPGFGPKNQRAEDAYDERDGPQGNELAT